jgi:hypothetical protein
MAAESSADVVTEQPECAKQGDPDRAMRTVPPVRLLRWLPLLCRANPSHVQAQ